jgi:hypothetical protein
LTAVEQRTVPGFAGTQEELDTGPSGKSKKGSFVANEGTGRWLQVIRAYNCYKDF